MLMIAGRDYADLGGGLARKYGNARLLAIVVGQIAATRCCVACTQMNWMPQLSNGSSIGGEVQAVLKDGDLHVGWYSWEIEWNAVLASSCVNTKHGPMTQRRPLSLDLDSARHNDGTCFDAVLDAIESANLLWDPRWGSSRKSDRRCSSQYANIVIWSRFLINSHAT